MSLKIAVGTIKEASDTREPFDTTKWCPLTRRSS